MENIPESASPIEKHVADLLAGYEAKYGALTTEGRVELTKLWVDSIQGETDERAVHEETAARAEAIQQDRNADLAEDEALRDKR